MNELKLKYNHSQTVCVINWWSIISKKRWIVNLQIIHGFIKFGQMWSKYRLLNAFSRRQVNVLRRIRTNSDNFGQWRPLKGKALAVSRHSTPVNRALHTSLWFQLAAHSQLSSSLQSRLTSQLSDLIFRRINQQFWKCLTIRVFGWDPFDAVDVVCCIQTSRSIATKTLRPWLPRIATFRSIWMDLSVHFVKCDVRFHLNWIQSTWSNTFGTNCWVRTSYSSHRAVCHVKSHLILPTWSQSTWWKTFWIVEHFEDCYYWMHFVPGSNLNIFIFNSFKCVVSFILTVLDLTPANGAV